MTEPAAATASPVTGSAAAIPEAALGGRPATVGRERSLVVAVTVVFFALYTTYSLSRYTTYLASGYDLGIFDQAVRAYAHFQAPIVPLKGPGYNVLGDHFHPIIAVIAPLYWIWDSPCTLLVVQSALIAGAIPIVYRFARRRTGSRVALVVGIAFGAGWAVQAMLDFDFHEIAFAVPLLAWAVDALDRRSDRQLLIACALLLLVREDMGVLVVVLGALRLAWSPRRVGAGLIIAGIVGYEVATAVIIPHFAPNKQFSYWQYGQLGPDLPSALGNMITHPWHAVSTFFSPWVKAQSLLYLLVPVAFLPLRSRYAWLALPLLAERYYNWRPELWTTHYHYSVLPWLIFMLAMVDAGSRIGVFRRPRLQATLVLWLLVIPVALTAFDHVTVEPVRRMIDGKAWKIDQHVRDQQAVVARIPSDVCAAVDDHLAPHLDSRDYVTLANAMLGQADFVAVDLGYPTIGGNNGPTPAAVLRQVESLDYKVILRAGDLRLLESPTYSGPSSVCHPLASGK